MNDIVNVDTLMALANRMCIIKSMIMLEFASGSNTTKLEEEFKATEEELWQKLTVIIENSAIYSYSRGTCELEKIDLEHDLKMEREKNNV